MKPIEDEIRKRAEERSEECKSASEEWKNGVYNGFVAGATEFYEKGLCKRVANALDVDYPHNFKEQVARVRASEPGLQLLSILLTKIEKQKDGEE